MCNEWWGLQGAQARRSKRRVYDMLRATGRLDGVDDAKMGVVLGTLVRTVAMPGESISTEGLSLLLSGTVSLGRRFADDRWQWRTVRGDVVEPSHPSWQGWWGGNDVVRVVADTAVVFAHLSEDHMEKLCHQGSAREPETTLPRKEAAKQKHAAANALAKPSIPRELGSDPVRPLMAAGALALRAKAHITTRAAEAARNGGAGLDTPPANTVSNFLSCASGDAARGRAPIEGEDEKDPPSPPSSDKEDSPSAQDPHRHQAAVRANLAESRAALER